MIQKQMSNWKIEFDKSATQTAYEALDTAEILCTCITCRNYYKAVLVFPGDVIEFFNSLGIDPSKPSEVYDLGFEDGYATYSGFYHIVGNYLSGDDIWQPVTKYNLPKKTVEMYSITEKYKIGFTHKLDLVPEGFSTPSLQMEISFEIPWVLDEPY